MVTKFLIPILLAGLLVTFFQNCSSFTTNDKIINNSQCTEQTRTKLFNEIVWPRSLCDNFEGYLCNVAFFRPNTKNGEFLYNECTFIDGVTICKEMAAIGFNTEKVSRHPADDQEQYREGGSYNRAEYTCIIPELNRDGLSLFQAEALSFDQALLIAQEKCYEGAQ